MSYSSEVLADSPLLYLRFEETAGATCANGGSLAGNATAAGTYTRNISTGLAGVGVGIDLDGISGVVTYPDTASLDITGDVTFECWLNVDTLRNSFMMSKGAPTGAATGGYALQLQLSGALRWYVPGFSSAISSAVITTGSWFHCACTRSGNNFVVYVNGSNVGSATVAATAVATAEPFTVGAWSVGGVMQSFSDGKFDEVAVYNTALSSTRVAAHYAARSTAGGGGTTFVPSIAIVG